MDNKSKFIIIILSIALAVAGFVAFQSAQSLSRDKNKYDDQIKKSQKSIDDLNVSLAQAKSDLKSAETKLEEIQKEISNISSERDDLKGRFEGASKDNQLLTAKISELQETLAKKSQNEQKAPVVSEDSYWASVLKDKAGLEVEVNSLGKQLEGLNKKLDDLTKQNNDLNVELNKVSQEKAELERKSEYNEDLPKTLSEELVKEKNERSSLAEQLDKIRQGYSLLQQQLKDETAQNLKLASQIEDLRREKELLTRRIPGSDAALQDAALQDAALQDAALQDRTTEALETKDQIAALHLEPVKSLSKDARVVELGPIVVEGGARQDYPQLDRGLSGSLLAVNKENNFVVIDIGESAGVKTGIIFSVYRDDVSIGSIKVIQARRDISAADILSIQAGQQLKVGDIVKIK